MNTTLAPAARAPHRAAAAPSSAVAPQAMAPRTGRRTAIALMAAGLTVSIVAIGLVTTTLLSSGTAPETAPLDVPATPTTAITISGTDGVAVHRMGYGPHESSSWHRHSGLHAIAVLSGTLTIVGPDCQPLRFGPGQSYVGGQGVHLARNDTDEPVEMSVTYLFPAGVPLQEFVIPATAPAGCQL